MKASVSSLFWVGDGSVSSDAQGGLPASYRQVRLFLECFVLAACLAGRPRPALVRRRPDVRVFFLTVAVSGGRAKTSVQVFVCSAPLSAQRAGLSEEHAATDGNHIFQLTDQSIFRQKKIFVA